MTKRPRKRVLKPTFQKRDPQDGRGGARKGSGRPRTLTPLEELVIGARCEELLDEEITRSRDKALADRFASLGTVPEIRNEIDAETRAFREKIEIYKREKGTHSNARRPLRNESFFDERREELAFAFEDQGDSRFQRLEFSLRSGLAAQIIRKVIQERLLSDEKMVSPSTIRQIWKKYRSNVEPIEKPHGFDFHL